MIIAAAIKVGKVITFMEKPNRHHDIIHSLAKFGHKTPITGIQGFMTNEGLFVNRVEGLEIAQKNNQIINPVQVEI